MQLLRTLDSFTQRSLALSMLRNPCRQFTSVLTQSDLGYGFTLVHELASARTCIEIILGGEGVAEHREAVVHAQRREHGRSQDGERVSRHRLRGALEQTVRRDFAQCVYQQRGPSLGRLQSGGGGGAAGAGGVGAGGVGAGGVGIVCAGCGAVAVSDDGRFCPEDMRERWRQLFG
eukprot:4938464-Pleurochrysis_carterae.AAC.2